MMKKFISVLTLVLTICVIAVTAYYHPNPSKAFCKSEMVIFKQPSQGILPGGCIYDPQKACERKMLLVGHSLGILFLLLGTSLAIIVLREKNNKHTDKEFDAKSEELSRIQASLEESNKQIEMLKSANESVKAELEKLEKENKAQIEMKEAEIEKAKAETTAAVNRAENLEKDNKGVKREVDKLNSQIRTAQIEKEEFKAKIIELQKELESQSEELKSLAANSKGGKDAVPPAAYQILYLLQKEGRLVDLLNEDISETDDESLGSAVRPVLEGCAKLLKDRLIVEPVLNEEEGSEVTVEEADPESIKLSGNVPASGPYKGELVHHGWRLKECNLPELVDGWKGNVIAPAEIEI